MGLARKKRKGGGLIDPRHKDLVFSDQVDVDNFIDNYGNEEAGADEVLNGVQCTFFRNNVI